MINSDDVAMKYEAIIRKCYNCDRFQHNADADIYRRLQSLYINAITTEESNPSYSDKWSDYNKQSDIVISSLNKALLNVNNSFSSNLDKANNETIGVDAISFELGKIYAQLFH